MPELVDNAYLLFGQLALAWSWVSLDNLHMALQVQHAQRATGQLPHRLGEVLVAYGMLREEHVRYILDRQLECGYVMCQACGTLRNPDAGHAACPRCGTANVVAAGPEALTSQGAYIGSYQVLGMLGQGGMGLVYKAFDPALNRTVALKVLHERTAMDQAAASKFINEAVAMAQLSHPNVIAIFNIDANHRPPYFAMEYVEGKDLDVVCGSTPKPTEQEILDYMVQAARGLAHAASKGLVHRDVKPANILINEERVAKLTDFGLAGHGASLTHVTADGQIVGTPLYVSPEQAQGLPLDFRSDIYSLGASLYHMLCGTAVFSGGSGADILRQHIHAPPLDIRRHAAHLPEKVWTTLAQCLAKDPAYRYQSYDHLIQDLLACAQEIGRPAHPVRGRLPGRTGKPIAQRRPFYR